MCGVSGVLSTTPNVTESLLRRANQSIPHRGPDEEGVWINESKTCGLGHVRLSIIDLARGKQPLSNPDGSIQAIVNGEFYGYEQIREEFLREGYAFKTQSDSEILIPLYQKYGEGCFEHLRGEFSLALWDANEQRLLVARDRFGIKPLFYAQHKDAFYFGSEVKALLAMGIPARWDTQTLLDDELGYRNCQDTLFENVKALAPGHFMSVRGGHIRTQKYWDFDYPLSQDIERVCSDEEYVHRFWALLTEAVKLRLRADVPVGVYLSGGIDSSAVLSLMSQHSQNSLDAFTLSFDHVDFDEGDIAREMAAYTGVRHTIIDIDPTELAPNFEDTIWHNECPFGNSNTVAKFILSRHVRDAGLKVVLTGEGSDEVLGGYAHYMTDMRHHNSTALGPTLAKPLRWLKRRLGVSSRGGSSANAAQAPAVDLSSVREKLGFVPGQLQGFQAAASNYAQMRKAGLGEADTGRLVCDRLMQSLDEGQLAGRDPLNQSLYLSSKSMLPNMILTTLGDRVEMAHSIEARLPFLDHKLVEFITQLPVDLKIKVKLKGGIEKYILKEAAKGHVTDTLYRRKKHPFTAPPTRRAVVDPMSELVRDTLHGSDMRNLEFYDQTKVLARYERLKQSGTLSGSMLRVAGLAIMQRKFGLSAA